MSAAPQKRVLRLIIIIEMPVVPEIFTPHCLREIKQCGAVFCYFILLNVCVETACLGICKSDSFAGRNSKYKSLNAALSMNAQNAVLDLSCCKKLVFTGLICTCAVLIE